MSQLSVLERLIEQDFGIELQGKGYARAIEHDSLVINREKQVFYWNSEGIVGDAFIYLTRVRKLPPQDAKEYLRNLSFTGTFVHEMRQGEETIVYPKLVDVFHEALVNGDKDYWYSRGITDETISRYKLGLYESDKTSYNVIPIYQDGVFKQFQMRRDSPKLIRAYYKNQGDLLFNSDILKITNKIFITEGLTSAILLGQNGIPAVSQTCGSEGFLAEWIRYFTHQREIYILFDNDSAGDFGAIRTAKILGEGRCRIYNFWQSDTKGYAVDDFLIDEGNDIKDLLNLIEKHSKFSFEMPGYNAKTKAYKK